MRDTAGQHAERLQLLVLGQLKLEVVPLPPCLRLLRDVTRDEGGRNDLTVTAADP